MDTGEPNRKIRNQFPFDRCGELIGRRLDLIGVDDLARREAAVPDAAAQEVAAVRIQVDFAGIVVAVAGWSCQRCVPVAATIGLAASRSSICRHRSNRPPPALEHGLARRW